jgi:tetratricopeptide (TPR) repeat protein
MKNHEAHKKIDTAFSREDWGVARTLILQELDKDPENHWLLTRLSTTYYEQHRYQEALEQVEKAFKITPRCPLVLWDYAGILAAMGQSNEALKIYSALIKKGPRWVGEENACGEGLEWALSLLADCIFRAGVCWAHLKKNEIALRWFQAFLKLRAEWNGGIHSPEEALKQMQKLAKNNPRRAKNNFGKVQKELLGTTSLV